MAYREFRFDMTRGILMSSLLAVGVVTFAAFGGPARADILIGLAGPITGKEAWLGEQFQRGAELAVADLNAAGGVLGQKVELITVDDFSGGRRRPEAGQ
jgi:branched-chain amino acid transport system substrate-binding protein